MDVAHLRSISYNYDAIDEENRIFKDKNRLLSDEIRLLKDQLNAFSLGGSRGEFITIDEDGNGIIGMSSLTDSIDLEQDVPVPGTI